ncbi:NitT/TauT family transport system substrate-binding protein [Parvibaculum indicum]|uniref:ABC transporter substrate-binding protein n=1 Tax=Parvibaculum indicum TaxID=562969 RepID=UPI001FE9663C|nr:ABC transporter substrate-binding protein [Parvibaculum indicum]NIJ40686.1 NitT/TauT family transport system substrate-binding protein [Parvibaculum indicum]
MALGLAMSAIMLAAPARAEAPLKIGYSDWPGWVAWQVAIDKGWLKEAGVAADFQWFDYVASMDAFAAGKLDAVSVTNGDALVMGGSGTKSIMILVNDYSNGNDMIIAKPGIKSLAELKGKKIGVEMGFVDHLLLLNGLEKADMTESDVELVNVATNNTPQVLASGDVDAVGAWQPSSGQAMKLVPGARPIYTSADEPGLIYDTLTVTPTSLANRRDEYVKLIKVWDKVVKYINDPETQPDALKIMSARVGLTPAQYKPLLNGTKLLTLEESSKFLEKGDGFSSLYGSSQISDDFNVKYKVYADPQDVDSYIDPSLEADALK